MPRHVVVDGSNLATEGRSVPSLKQLNEAVLAYMSENPDALITVVVDATFGHRIDAKEVAEFDAAVSNNEIVAPPAGAIGRGDAFVLSIANKVNATILSNDSYQEFHGTHPWLFDEGRLVGGKPVPHIGWVFVNRLPVRGPTSRKSVSEAKRGRVPKVKSASPEASQPMPIPAAPPPGATLHKPGRGRDAKPAAAAAANKPADAAKSADAAKQASDPRAEPTPRSTGTNDLLAFLTFVEHHTPGSSVNAIVENYSSHGAYVRIGDVKGYVPLSLMSDPPPR
ncbi:MAG TPA: S1 RNA-binding domain-containing protein, partial [Ilumatobacteraceae bacterium]|nr:S1 RNA-binding domain-containing protein [Ilumatobacteraceae bacterium]